MYLLQAMKILRGYSLNEWDAVVLKEAFDISIKDTVVNVISEIGGSVQCLTQTIQEVDTGTLKENTILYAFLKAIIPVNIIESLNLGVNVQSLSAWITEAGGGQAGTAAWGYAAFAEPYFNFGDNGYYVMLAVGFVWGLLENLIIKLISKKYLLSAMAILYFLSYAIFFARAELMLFSTPGRYALYIVIIMYVLKKLMPRQLKGI